VLKRASKRAVLAAVLALLGALQFAPASSGQPAKAATSNLPVVSISNFTFGPSALTIKAGTTVTWVNQDDVPHALLAVDKSFRSKVLDTDERFSFTFTKPGTYGYFCTLHPHMTGKVVVTRS
jgi:amicyanin